MASNSVFSELLKSCKLDGSNFTVWKRKIMFLLSAENIDYIIDESEPEEPGKDATIEEKEEYEENYATWTKNNKRARIFILGSMTDSLAAEYEGEQSARKIMRTLEKDFGEVSLVKVLSLVNRFLSTKMNHGDSVNQHLNKLCVLAEELKIAGYPFSEEVQVMVVLNSLPSTWENFKTNFCHFDRVLNMRNLRNHLLMEEDIKLSEGKGKNSNHTELHLGEEKKNYNKRSWQKRKPNDDLRETLNRKRGRDDRGNNSAQRDDWYKKFPCHNCGELGHFRADCKKKRKYSDQKKQNNKSDEHKGKSPPNGSPQDLWPHAVGQIVAQNNLV
uniref:CCHC-type domain-containing protein n=1 Tax=Leersia perrieri TaxID=77586 RepID=A0A0D9V2E6_9ORYZ